MANPVSLFDIFPIYKIEDNCIISRQGDITVAFEVQLPEIFTLSDQEYESLHQVLVRAIRVLPVHSVFHKQDWFTKRTHREQAEEKDLSFLSKASERFFLGRPYLEHRCYIMLTRRSSHRKDSNSLYSNLLRKTIVPEETLNLEKMQDFFDSAGQFHRILSDSGFVKLVRLNNESLTGSANKSGLLEKYCFLADSDKPLVRDIHLRDGIKIGDQYSEIYSLSDVEDLPALCGSRINYDKYSTDKTKFSVGFATSLGQLLNCNHIYNQFIFIEDTQKTIKKLESKRLRLQSLSAYSRENSISRDATNDYLNELITSQRLPVKAHFNVMIWTDDRNELKELKTQVSSALAQMDATPKQESDGAPQLFWSGLPGNAGDFPANDTFDTFAEQAACFLNLESSSKSVESNFRFRLVDRLSGMPVWCDFSDAPMRSGVITNRNKAVFGGSGSGKSMFMNHLQHAYYAHGAHCLIVDVGNSYQGLCELLNGYQFMFREEKPIQFNPFYIAEGDTLDTEKKESIKTLLIALWKKDDEKFKRSEYVALSNALHQYYDFIQDRPAIFPGFDSFYDFLLEVYVERLASENVKESDFDVNNFLYVLRPYYKNGEYGYLLNAREKLDIFHQRFIVFELDNIKDHPILFPVVTLIIMELFISKMRKLKGIRKVITIEEAWKAIAKAGMAEFLKYLYKTVRKFYGEAIVVSQELDDVISSPIVKEAILNNSDCKVLLDMRKFQNKFEQIQTVLGMQDKGKAMVLSLNKANDPKRRYRELYVDLAGQQMKVYGYEPSPEEYFAYTTEESEKVKVQAYAKAHNGNIQKGIEALIRETLTKSV